MELSIYSTRALFHRYIGAIEYRWICKWFFSERKSACLNVNSNWMQISNLQRHSVTPRSFTTFSIFIHFSFTFCFSFSSSLFFAFSSSPMLSYISSIIPSSSMFAIASVIVRKHSGANKHHSVDIKPCNVLWGGGVLQWVSASWFVICSQGFEPHQRLTRCFLDQILPSLLSTGWFKEQIQGWLHNQTNMSLKGLMEDWLKMSKKASL